MARKADDKRWNSKFAQFVQGYGVEQLASRLGVNPSAVYHWMRGSTSPHPANAQAIQRLAKRRGVALSLDDIYQHFRDVRSERYLPASPRSPQPARAI